MSARIKRTIILGMLIAIEIILSRFLSISTTLLKISFAFMALAVAGMMFGPLWAGVVGALADLLGATLFPIGLFIPGFTLSAFLTGCVFGLFLYRTRVKWYHAAASSLIVCVVIRMGMDTFWLYQVLGQGIIPGIPSRIIANSIMIVVMTLTILLMQYPVERLMRSANQEFIAYLRVKCRSYYKNVKEGVIEQISNTLTDKLLELPVYKNANTVFCFVGKTGSEIDTKRLLERILHDKKQLCVPLCAGNGIMTARAINSLDDLTQVGSFGILEPAPDSLTVEKHTIDLIVVPCSAVDKRHNRVGKGSGYYDNYLSDSTAFKLGLCPQELVINRLPAQRHDVPLDLIITEKKSF